MRDALERGLRRPLVSRRTLLVGGGSGAVLAALAAVGGPMLLNGSSKRPGKLVPELLTARPFYVAHGGGSADWPEFSLYAYRQAVAEGADALEVSLARSSDGVWFGLHDPTLDRTSGTSGFVASEHDWYEIESLRISTPRMRRLGQEPRPYLRFEQLVAAYGRTHAIFVDPKTVDSVHHAELLDMMAALVRHPVESFVAKSFCTGRSWAQAARARGLRTWGYYYGAQVQSGETPPQETQDRWDLLGLDVQAPDAVWQLFRGLGKPLVGHVVADRPQAESALGHGAQGLMVSGLREVLGGA